MDIAPGGGEEREKYKWEGEGELYQHIYIYCGTVEVPPPHLSCVHVCLCANKGLSFNAWGLLLLSPCQLVWPGNYVRLTGLEGIVWVCVCQWYLDKCKLCILAVLCTSVFVGEIEGRWMDFCCISYPIQFNKTGCIDVCGIPPACVCRAHSEGASFDSHTPPNSPLPYN